MKYDILTLQFFQEALEKVEERRFDEQRGICDALHHVCFMRNIKDSAYDSDLVKWMQKNYMPYKGVGEFWWPVGEFGWPEEVVKDYDLLIQSKEDRIAFLKRIIEDLMCGE
jgi:hypothetical protein